jgi:hypothetical protein
MGSSRLFGADQKSMGSPLTRGPARPGKSVVSKPMPVGDAFLQRAFLRFDLTFFDYFSAAAMHPYVVG